MTAVLFNFYYVVKNSSYGDMDKMAFNIFHIWEICCIWYMDDWTLTYFICCTRSYVGSSKPCKGYVTFPHILLQCSHFSVNPFSMHHSATVLVLFDNGYWCSLVKLDIVNDWFCVLLFPTWELTDSGYEHQVRLKQFLPSQKLLLVEWDWFQRRWQLKAVPRYWGLLIIKYLCAFDVNASKWH